MTGLRKRVTVGFLSIVCLLFFSGMISLLELGHLSRDTGEILKANARNIELAKEMLDAAHEQNMALIRMSVFGDRSRDSLCRASMDRLENTLLVAQNEAFLDSLAFATTELRIVTDNYLAFGDLRSRSDSLAADSLAGRPDSLGIRWYNEEYDALYGRLTAAKNAYRAVTPVLISVTVMIAIVLMLLYFLSIYCVSPIERMNKSLGDWLSFRTPFNVKGDLKDEVLELKERIETLINQSKQPKA